MEDIRKLLKDHEAVIAPESLGYLLCGLTATVHELIQEGPPSDSREGLRHREMMHSVSFFAQLSSVMLARWLGEHMDECTVESGD